MVRLDFKKRDRYDRVKVLVDECEINLHMVSSGLVWHYPCHESEQAPADMTALEFRIATIRLLQTG